jgi:hypothetical protein
MLTIDELRRPSDSHEPQEPIERIVGEWVAVAAGAIGLGMMERIDGGLRRETKVRGGDAIAELYQLRLFVCGAPDFETVARKWGKVVLRERLARLPDRPVSTEAQLDEVISWVLSILDKVVRARVH